MAQARRGECSFFILNLRILLNILETGQEIFDSSSQRSQAGSRGKSKVGHCQSRQEVRAQPMYVLAHEFISEAAIGTKLQERDNR